MQSPRHIQFIDTVLENADHESPRVGIFWYSPTEHELFGTVAKVIEDCPQTELITCPELHKHIWQKEFNKQRFKNDGKGPFQGNWKDTPRGRIFFDKANNVYIICIGSWIKEHTDAIDLIVDRFHLNSVHYEFSLDEHWEIGNGWGDEV